MENRIKITDKMLEREKKESEKREQYINHHFSQKNSNKTGFLGEFACLELFNLNWENNIRADYLNIDEYDFIIGDKKVDVKTETVPQYIADKILSNDLCDDVTYGRRLIHKNQVPLLNKYDLIIWGFFIKDKYDYWYPIGYLESDYIIANYKVTKNRPDGGVYPFSALPIRLSELKPLSKLI